MYFSTSLISILLVMCFPTLSFSSCIIQDRNYSVVIDAKLFETKAWVYGFLNSERSALNITSPFSQSNGCGFSMCFSNSTKYFKKLLNLVNMTRKRVPDMDPSKTPLTLVATGVKDLNITTFFHNVSEYLNTTGFILGNGSVTQLHGRRKLYSWMAVNLLLGRFENKTQEPTAAVLDLGTGSAHEEFEKTSNLTLTRKQKKHVTNVTICGKHYDVYGASVSGLGLHEGRLKMLLQGNVTVGKDPYMFDSKTKEPFNITNITTVCINPNASIRWTYKDKTYSISGAPSNSTGVNVTACRLLADNVINNHTKDLSLLGKEIYGMGYYYQVLYEAYTVSFGNNKNITINDIEEQTNKKCNESLPTKHWMLSGVGKESFACMDLIYVHELLMKFYQLKNESWVDVLFRVNGINVEWPLGLAYERYKAQLVGNYSKPH